LASNPSSKLNYDDKEVPIFIVGNGPSLDSSIEAIKEWQGQAIVISCGTTLQALHRNGITPDFHAEIEQNRSTYDWAVLIGDLQYLKDITLISCNGIHPDTCDLYKDVMIAFKEGESSTVSALNVLGRENFTTLLNSFPTVSNFAIDLFSTIGFTSIYLIGVDLGFLDVKHHHSKSSGYYHDDGQETYDYAQSANTSLIVSGNFRPRVNTKHEFKVSRQVIEQVTSAKFKGQEFYNCSDGAKIQGTLPIRPEELLIVVTEQQKIDVVRQLKTNIFSNANLDNYLEDFDKVFANHILINELKAFEKLLVQEITSKEQVKNLINKQKEMLFSSYRSGQSLLFYYLYGTVNYANAALTKLLFSSSKTTEPSSILQETKGKWRDAVIKIEDLVSSNETGSFDKSSYNKNKRQIINLKQNCPNRSILIVTDSLEFRESIKHILETEFSWIDKVNIITPLQIETIKEIPDYAIYQIDTNKDTPINGKINTIIVVQSNQNIPADFNGLTYLKITDVESKNLFKNPVSLARSIVNASFNTYKCSLILPKYIVSEGIDFEEEVINLPNNEYTAFDYSYYICLFSPTNTQHAKGVLNNGSRAEKITQQLKMKNLFYLTMNEEDFNEHKRKAINLVSSKILVNQRENDNC
jgi:hypothetical protein